MDISDAVVRNRENELIVAVTNTCTDRFGCDNRGWKGQSGGIPGYDQQDEKTVLRWLTDPKP